MQVTSETVNQMRKEFNEGVSQSAIAEKFNKLGYKGARGSELTQSRVSAFIRSKIGYKRAPARQQKSTSQTTKADSLFLDILTAPYLSDTKKVNTLISLME